MRRYLLQRMRDPGRHLTNGLGALAVQVFERVLQTALRIPHHKSITLVLNLHFKAQCQHFKAATLL